MIFLAILGVLFSETVLLRPTEAVPINFSTHPTSENASPSYVPDPRGRGTYGLLLSSMITLVLCIYTSIHLNIAPDHHMFQFPFIGIGLKRATSYKLNWMFIALLAPEFVFFAALNQWLEARKLLAELRKIEMDDTDPQPGEAGIESTELHTEAIELPTKVAEPGVEVNEIQSEAKRPLLDTAEPPTNSIPEMLKPTISILSDIQDWTDITTTAAFFVVMGEVAYRRRNYLGIPNSEIKYPNLALTPVGFLELAKAKVLHPGILDGKGIEDRSKADSVARFLVCAQALWMVINVIARKCRLH
jgi:hypothetical protein